jgi:TonB-linked SusC/RagA family outer membrane protein
MESGRVKRTLVMMMRVFAFVFTVSLILPFGGNTASAQMNSSESDARAPRFLLASSTPSIAPRPLDVARTSVLRQRIAIDLAGVSLRDALAQIGAKAGIKIGYSNDVIPAHQRVHLEAGNITVAAALTDVLADLEVDVVFSPTGGAALVRRPKMANLQAGTIVGRVTDAKGGQGLAGATVTVDGTQRSAISGESGEYRLANVPVGNHTLTARRLGYEKVTTSVVVADGAEVTANFSLNAVVSKLEQVVTTATGPQRRVEVGNSIARIDADSVVATAPVTSLSDVISARAPGVQVFASGGLVGASPEINIRGQNSLQLSNQPLLVIDGVRVNNTTAGGPPDGTFIGVTAGGFNNIIPEDIASIEIVKGPSAATLYGTDAANGVIVITTKRGVAGERRWHLFGELGKLSYNTDNFQDNYYAWGKLPNGTQVNCTLQLLASGACTQDSVTHFNPLKFGPTTPIGTGSRNSLGAQVSGGNAVQYFASAVYEDEIGYLKMPDVDRARVAAERGATGIDDDALHPNAARKIGVRTNLTAPIGRNADLMTSASYLTQQSRLPYSAILLYSLGPGYRDANDGWLFGARPADVFIQRHDESLTHFTGNGTGTWRPASWLSTRATTGIDFSSTFYDALTRPGEGGIFAVDPNGYRGNTKTNATLYTGDVGATATFDLTPWLNSRTSIGGQYNRSQTLINSATAKGLAPGSMTVNGGARPSVSESNIESVVAGSYVEQTFGLRDHLFLTGAVRVDGASTFGNNFKTATYPKASLSWVVPHVPGFSSLRLRAAYGTSGVQPSAIAALARDTLFPAIADGQVVTGGRLSALGNSNLRPERQREFEGGFDAEWFEGRARVEATAYNKRSTDALIDVPLGSSIGGGSLTANVGAVKNTGLELLVALRPIVSDPITWNVSLNGSTNKNELITLGPDVLPTYGIYGQSSIVAGYPLFAYFDHTITGYADANGDGILEANEVTVGPDPVYIGPSYPKTQFTVSNSFSLFRDQLRVSALVDHRGSFLIANRALSDKCGFGSCQAAIDPDASFADQAAILAYGPNFGYTYTGFFENGSFTRLRELSVTYQLPKSFLGTLHSRSASVTLAGRNLALWTKFRGGDPEIQSNLGGPVRAAYTVEGGLPPARYWTVRINLDM